MFGSGPRSIFLWLPRLLHVPKIRRVDFSPDEWIAGCLGLTAEEEGIYIRMIMRYYSRGGPLPADPVELGRLCGVRPQMMRRVLPKLLPKFEETDGKLRQNRCETEIKLAENRIETARLNGAKGGRPNGLAKAGGSQSEKPNHQPSTTNHQQIDSEASPLAAEPPYDPVKDIFDRGLKMLGGDTKPHRSLLGKARRDHGDEAVLAAIVACEHEMPSEPAEYLIGCLSRAGPRRNGHSKSPGDKLWEGAFRAAESYNRKHGIVEGDRGDRDATVVPLLDRR